MKTHLGPEGVAAYLAGDTRNDAAAVEAHVAGCRDCAGELARMRRLVAEVERAALDVQPPEGLRERVFAAVAVDDVARIARTAALEHLPPRDLEERTFARLAGVMQEDALGTSEKGSPRAGDQDPMGHVVDVAERFRRRSKLLTVAAAGLAAAVIALALIGLGMRDRLADLEREVADGLPPEYPTGHPMQEIELRGPGGSASAELVHFRQNNYKFLVSTSRVLPLRAGFHYEVWLVGPLGEASAGSFRLIKPDDPLLIFNVGVDPSLYPRLVITREADDGNPGRDGPVLLEGAIDPSRVRHHE